MFSGAQVNGGTFYNVQGDINVHSHHHQYLALHGASSSAPRLKHRDDEESRRPLAIEDRAGDPMPQPEFAEDIAGGTTERTLAGATRHPRRHAATGRHAPYDVASRPRHPTNSYNEGFPESSSSNDLPMGYADTDPHVNPPHHPAHTSDLPDGHPYPNLPPPLAGAHITAQNVNHHWRGETGIDILHRAAALDALYDSADSYPQPRCHPETRTEMLNKLYNWCTNGNTEHPICWLHGPAGAGKSAIMQTLSRRLQDAGRLGGAFFFKRHHPTRGNAKVLFATLAYQLVLNNQDLKHPISENVEIDPSIVAREMKVQLHKLIIEPCQSLANSRPAILLLDGLDECQDERTQQEILRLIGNAVAQCPTEIRTIVASRPETHIREVVEESLFDGLINSTNVEQSFDDVRTYLRDEFARIHNEHRDTMARVPHPWPSSDVLHSLVRKSSGYFVYASTVIKFVDDPYSRPNEQLEIVQNLTPTQYDAPFEALDNLYHEILSGVRPRFQSRLLCILQCVAWGFSLRPVHIDYILGLQPGDTKLILRGLHSVLKVPHNNGWISFHHASFPDFLDTQERSLSFHLGFETQMKVAQAVLTAASDESTPRPESPYPWVTRFLTRYITFVPHSPELIPCVQRISLDFIWMDQDNSPYKDSRVAAEVLQLVTAILTWLKAINPPPGTLIQRWKTYYLTSLWEAMQVRRVVVFTQSLFSLSPEMLHKLQIKMARLLPLPLAKYQQLAVQSPRCTRILQAMWLLDSCGIRVGHLSLSHIRFLLDETWDEIINTISLLHATTYTANKSFPATKAAMIAILSHSLELRPASGSTLFCDLVHRCFRLVQSDMLSAVQDSHNAYHSQRCQVGPDLRSCWGIIIRYSPQPNPELLRLLHEFNPPWDHFSEANVYRYYLHPRHFHNVLQWLKAHAAPPMELISHWQNHLEKSKSLVFLSEPVSFDHLESQWPRGMAGTNFNMCSHKLHLDPEEVIYRVQGEVEWPTGGRQEEAAVNAWRDHR